MGKNYRLKTELDILREADCTCIGKHSDECLTILRANLIDVSKLSHPPIMSNTKPIDITCLRCGYVGNNLHQCKPIFTTKPIVTSKPRDRFTITIETDSFYDAVLAANIMDGLPERSVNVVSIARA